MDRRARTLRGAVPARMQKADEISRTPPSRRQLREKPSLDEARGARATAGASRPIAGSSPTAHRPASAARTSVQIWHRVDFARLMTSASPRSVVRPEMAPHSGELPAQSRSSRTNPRAPKVSRSHARNASAPSPSKPRCDQVYAIRPEFRRQRTPTLRAGAVSGSQSARCLACRTLTQGATARARVPTGDPLKYRPATPAT